LFIPLQWTIFLGAGLSMILYIYASATHVRLVHLVRNRDGKFEESDVPEVYPSNQTTAIVFEGTDFYAEVPLFVNCCRLNKTLKMRWSFYAPGTMSRSLEPPSNG
jgi:hypothetical protein